MKSKAPFDSIVEIMDILRSENGCPWDRSQTLKTLRKNIIEESYELVDAITKEDYPNIKEEAGDLLLQSVFIAQLLKESGKGDIDDILSRLKEKLIRRHPHVFGDKKVNTPEEALASWNSVKDSEKTDKFDLEKYKKFPALTEAYKITRKLEKSDLDWDKPFDVFEKIDEELEELQRAINKKQKDNIEEEIGDLLFTIVNLSRKLDIEPEIALKRANRKFIQRVKKVMKEKEKNINKNIDELWEYVKQNNNT